MAITRRVPVVKNVGFFALTLALAILGDWRSGDIAWSMWLASLFIGYAYAIAGLGASHHRDADSTAGLGGIGLGSMVALLAIFTLHFGGFHYLHAVILGNFFPLVPGAYERELLGGMATSVNLGQIMALTLKAYLPFALIAVAFETRDILAVARGQAPFNIVTPYASVVKNHLVIVVLAVLVYLLDSRLVLYGVLAAYFFPYDELLAWLAPEREQQPVSR